MRLRFTSIMYFLVLSYLTRTILAQISFFIYFNVFWIFYCRTWIFHYKNWIYHCRNWICTVEYRYSTVEYPKKRIFYCDTCIYIHFVVAYPVQINYIHWRDWRLEQKEEMENLSVPPHNTCILHSTYTCNAYLLLFVPTGVSVCPLHIIKGKGIT